MTTHPSCPFCGSERINEAYGYCRDCRRSVAGAAQDAPPPREPDAERYRAAVELGLLDPDELDERLAEVGGIIADAAVAVADAPPSPHEKECERLAALYKVAEDARRIGAAPAAPQEDAPLPTSLEQDRQLLAAWTPEGYAGAYPPYINLTMLRMNDNVVLTVRQPTVHGGPPGETATITFTPDMWRALVEAMPGGEQ